MQQSESVSRKPLASRPDTTAAVPDAVVALAGGDAIEAVWRNQLGGLTFRVGAGTARDRYVKWVAHGTTGVDLAAEAARLGWLQRRVAVPQLLDQGADEIGAWLVTAAIPATSAVEPPWAGRPATAATAIGAGLRALHDTLAPAVCPFRWDIASRLGRAAQRIAAGDGPPTWFPEHRHLTISQAWDLLTHPPPIDRLVVCHGDACAPNTLVGPDGRFAAHVDVGHLGVADRWADLAIAAWSAEWNYGPGYTTAVYDAYGITPTSTASPTIDSSGTSPDSSTRSKRAGSNSATGRTAPPPDGSGHRMAVGPPACGSQLADPRGRQRP